MLGKSWFFSERDEQGPACLIEGKPAALEDGIERAARILTEARYPIIYGLDPTHLGSPARGGFDRRLDRRLRRHDDQRRATARRAWHCKTWARSPARSGEIKNRGDLIIFWGSNPAESHPRHLTRYSLMPEGIVLAPRPQGPLLRRGRRAQDEKQPRPPTCSFAIKPGKEFEALWALRAPGQGGRARRRAC